MSLWGNTENYELTLPMDYDTTFKVFKAAAETFGVVTDENAMLGMLQFKKGLSLVRNAVKFNANFVRQGEHSTVVKIVANSGDGIVGMNSTNRAYQEFLSVLSSLTK